MSEFAGVTGENRLQPIATRTFAANAELYKVVDFLNKTLRPYALMFGVTLNNQEGTMTISVYKV